jgi:hypothetical protein
LVEGEGQVTENAEEFDAEADHYPPLIDVIRAVVESENIPPDPVERFEVTLLANGQATYRVWPARAEEYEGGVFSLEDLQA